MVMTLTNLVKIKLKKSNHVKIIFIFFTLAVALTNVMKNLLSNYDTILTVSDFQNKELERAENIYNLPKKKLFTVGYFYYEYLKKKFFWIKKWINILHMRHLGAETKKSFQRLFHRHH